MPGLGFIGCRPPRRSMPRAGDVCASLGPLSSRILTRFRSLVPSGRLLLERALEFRDEHETDFALAHEPEFVCEPRLVEPRTRDADRLGHFVRPAEREPGNPRL